MVKLLTACLHFHVVGNHRRMCRFSRSVDIRDLALLLFRVNLEFYIGNLAWVFFNDGTLGIQEFDGFLPRLPKKVQGQQE